MRIRVPRRIAYLVPDAVDVPPIRQNLMAKRHRRVPLRYGTDTVVKTVALRGYREAPRSQYVAVDRRGRLVQYSMRRTNRYLYGRQKAHRPYYYKAVLPEENTRRDSDDEDKSAKAFRVRFNGQLGSLRSDSLGLVGANVAESEGALEAAAGVSRALQRR